MDEEDGRGTRDGAPLTAHRRRSGASRHARGAALAAVCALLLAAPGDATARDERSSGVSSSQDALVTTAQSDAIDSAIDWIASHQQPGGMWGEERGTRVADTALSLLALMAAGHTVTAGASDETGSIGPPLRRGKYAERVERGLRYLADRALAQTESSVKGYIKDDQQSRMHGHGFATLALATACGNLGASRIADIKARVAKNQPWTQFSFADKVRYALELAVHVIRNAQDPDTGGWYYDPQNSGHEGSMTVTQIAALRAAAEAGVSIDSYMMKNAYNYVRNSQNRGHPQKYGGFTYEINSDRVSYGLTAAALTTLFGLGRYGDKPDDAKMIELGLTYLDRTMRENLEDPQWFYYDFFYGAQALYLADDARRLRRDWPQIRRAVLRMQLSNGSFRTVEAERSTEYSTAMACLTLQVPTEGLPIFQRR